MNKNEVPYYETLVNLREFLENNVPAFPFLRCQYSSRVLSKVLGLKQPAGYYMPMNIWHAWSYDNNLKLYIDLTMDQFNENHNKIMILPKENPWIVSHPTLTSNHLMTQDCEFNPKIDYLVKKFQEEYSIK
jgi:hypothetical protein